MPVMLVISFSTLSIMFGLTVSVPIMAVVGTAWTFIAAFLRWGNRPRRDHGRFRDGNTGRYISTRSGILGYITAGSALILPFMTKADIFVNSIPLMSSWPLEAQAGYALAMHGIGFGLSQ